MKETKLKSPWVLLLLHIRKEDKNLSRSWKKPTAIHAGQGHSGLSGHQIHAHMEPVSRGAGAHWWRVALLLQASRPVATLPCCHNEHIQLEAGLGVARIELVRQSRL